MQNINSIIECINTSARDGKPFFLLTDFELQQCKFYSIQDLLKENILVQFPQFSNVKEVENKFSITLEKIVLEKDDYKLKFDKVISELKYGNSYLTNLTIKTPIESKHTLNEIFFHACAKYKLLYKNEWLCFSPETFITINDSIITTYPMKGTIDALLPNAKEILLNDEKEIAEHYTIVDLMRNDLGMVAENIQVAQFRYLESIKTNTKEILQTSSKITGVLHPTFRNQLGEIIFKLLPAGSVSGAPKQKTLEIIKEAEEEKRKFYTGVAFYFDGKNLDSCVLIRFIESEHNQLYYRSGGGITIHSNLMSEYEESLNKIYVPFS